jgi:hypothetical protein
MKRALPLAIGLLTLALLLAAWNEGRRPHPISLTPSLTGQPEYCLTCHADLPQISAAHSVQVFGCVSCHGGQRLALTADQAHAGLRGGRNPSDLAVVEASCGSAACHSGPAAAQQDHIQRVTTSLQATYAGAIATVRYAFGAQPDARARQAIFDINAPPSGSGLAHLDKFAPSPDSPPAVLTFAANCLNCHLSAQPLAGAAYTRFTGCAACHTPTAGADPNQSIHRLTTAIPYTQCNTCHNRGNYSMRDLQFHARTDTTADRLHDYYQPIAQFTRCEYELDCVDCHTSGEVMGDGGLHNNQKEVRYIQCQTCHGTLAGPPLTRTVAAGDIALRRAFLNPVVKLQAGDTIVVTSRGEPVWNLIRQADGVFKLFSKVGGAAYAVPLAAGSACKQRPDQRDSRYCHQCHSVAR